MPAFEFGFSCKFRGCGPSDPSVVIYGHLCIFVRFSGLPHPPEMKKIVKFIKPSGVEGQIGYLRLDGQHHVTIIFKLGDSCIIMIIEDMSLLCRSYL